jgi:hypothetical protein
MASFKFASSLLSHNWPNSLSLFPSMSFEAIFTCVAVSYTVYMHLIIHIRTYFPKAHFNSISSVSYPIFLYCRSSHLEGRSMHLIPSWRTAGAMDWPLDSRMPWDEWTRIPPTHSHRYRKNN